MNRLHKTESAVFKLWVLYFQRICIQIIKIFAGSSAAISREYDYLICLITL